MYLVAYNKYEQFVCFKIILEKGKSRVKLIKLPLNFRKFLL